MLSSVFRKLILNEQHASANILKKCCLLSFSTMSKRDLSTDLRGQEQKVVIDNKTINYLKTGTGPHNVLCLPGALGSIWSDFKPQIEDLSKEKFTLVVWDPPGYGYSRPPERDFSPGYFQRDAEMAFKLMQTLNLGKFSCLGWSDGGITALIMAGSRPADVEKLVVWGANAFVTQTDIDLYESIRDLSKWSVAMKSPLIELYTEPGLTKLWGQFCDAFLHILKHQEGNICKDYLGKIEAPTFILHGAKDPMVPSYHPPFLREHIKNTKYFEFKDGKHNIHLKYKTEFNAKVQDFLLS